MLVTWKTIKFGLILGFLGLCEVHFHCFWTRKQENRHTREGILLWAHGHLDIVQRRHYFRTIGSDVGRHLSEFGSLSRPPTVQKSRKFRISRVRPSAIRQSAFSVRIQNHEIRGQTATLSCTMYRATSLVSLPSSLVPAIYIHLSLAS